MAKLTICGGGLSAKLVSDTSTADRDGVPSSCAVTWMRYDVRLDTRGGVHIVDATPAGFTTPVAIAIVVLERSATIL